MVEKIISLTDEQVAGIPDWKRKWIEIGLATGDADFERAEAAFRFAYSAIGVPFPKKVVRVESPFVGTLAACICNRLLNGKVLENELRHEISSDVDVAIWEAIWPDVHEELVHNTLGAGVGEVVYKKVYEPISLAFADLFSLDEESGSIEIPASDPAVVHHWDTVSAIVERITGETIDDIPDGLRWHRWGQGQFALEAWAGSPVYMSFLTDICGLRMDPKMHLRLEAWLSICESINFFWPNSEFLILCDRPVRISRDNKSRLHHTVQKAIEYKDGWGLWYVQGHLVKDSVGPRFSIEGREYIAKFQPHDGPRPRTWEEKESYRNGKGNSRN
ncbi:MAG: hypothetical protein IPM63_13485 [Acidobacteriota bacterium]|nr:MAG: hypothetical protein IPM63_13485 [Acidobacteriota bacterium]